MSHDTLYRIQGLGWWEEIPEFLLAELSFLPLGNRLPADYERLGNRLHGGRDIQHLATTRLQACLIFNCIFRTDLMLGIIVNIDSEDSMEKLFSFLKD